MKINLHIDRVILEGVNINPGQQHLLQTSLETELGRLLADRGFASNLTQSLTLSCMTTGAIQLMGNDPAQLGQQIAQSVYGGIGHE